MQFKQTEAADSFEFSEHYKLIMDKMIENHNKGKSKYLSEVEFRKATLKR